MENKEHHKREAYFLMAFILVFGIAFLIAVSSFLRHVSMLGIGLGYRVENGMIAALSVFGILRVLYELMKP